MLSSGTPSGSWSGSGSGSGSGSTRPVPHTHAANVEINFEIETRCEIVVNSSFLAVHSNHTRTHPLTRERGSAHSVTLLGLTDEKQL